MKILIFTLFTLVCFSLTNAQSLRGLDKSPLDIAYLPDNYAHDRKPGEQVFAKVVYSRPLKKERVIFGGVVPYGEVWRTGANENTEIRFYKDVSIAGSSVKAGTYSLFTIPGMEAWTIILNSDLDYWGAFSYNKEHDVLRIQTVPHENSEIVEAFTIQFDNRDEKNAIMKMAWDNVIIEIPIKY